ncbi:MAG: fibronectin type III domain-containing protein, partial [Promethearchaeota archaeon]
EEYHVGEGTFEAKKTGSYEVEITLDQGVAEVGDGYKELRVESEYIIKNPEGETIIDESDWGRADSRADKINATMEVTYNIYGQEEVEKDLEVDSNLKVFADKRTLNVDIENKSDEEIILKGYVRDEEDEEDNMIIMGEPFKRTDPYKFKKPNKNSVEEFGLEPMPTIDNEFLPANQEKINELGSYLLDNYSMPKTILEIKTKPLPQLEIYDKVKVEQDERDIDDEFFIKEIKHNFNKDGFWDMDLVLEQARKSDWEWEDDGTPVLGGGGDEEDKYEKPSAVTGLKVSLRKASKDGSNKIKLSWDDHSGSKLDHYNVYRKGEDESKFSIVDSVHKNTNFYEDTSITYGEEYSYRVSVVDENGNESDQSNEESVTVIDDEEPASVEFDRIKWRADHIKITWNPPEDEDYEEIELRLDKNFGSKY